MSVRLAFVVAWLTAAPAAASEVVLWHSHRAGEAEALDAVMSRFREQHPSIHVRVLQVPYGAYTQKLRTAIPQGAGPDIFIGPNDYLRDFVDRGLIVPARGVAVDRFDKQLTDALVLNGQLWGYPTSYKTLLLFYNRAFIDHAPGTTEELIAMAKPLSGDGRYGFAYQASVPYYHAPWIFGFGGQFFDGDDLVPFDNPKAIAAADFLRRLVAIDAVTPVDLSGALTTELFNRGRAAMVMNGPWFVSEIAPEVKWGVAPLPIVTETGLPARPFASLDVVYMTPQGAGAPEVTTLVDALTSDEAALTRARIGRQAPANVAVTAQVADDPLLSVLAKQIQTSAPLPTQPIMQVAWDPYEGALRQIQRGALTPAVALRDCFKRVMVLARPLPPKADARLYVLVLLVAVAVGIFALIKRAPPGTLADIKRSGLAYGFVAPAAIGMALLVGVPFLMGVGVGFFEFGPNEVRFVGLSNFASIIVSRDYAVYQPMSFYFTMAVTILWTVVNIALHVGIGFGFALLLQPTWLKGRGIFRVLLILPWAVPNYITGLIFKGLFNTQLGAVNALLAKIGLAPVGWFDHFLPAFCANLVTNVWLGFPFMMVTIMGALQSIPADLYEAARIDGAGPWRRFVSVTLPLVGPALVPSVVLGTIWTFNMFNVVFLVSEGQPESATDILVTEAYRWAFMRNGRYGYAAAYSLIIFGILLLYSALTKRLLAARVEST